MTKRNLTPDEVKYEDLIVALVNSAPKSLLA